MALTLVFTLCACGKNGESDMDDNEEHAKNNIDDYKAGDYITFGSYEQDGNISNGKEDVEWIILDVKGDKALVISKYVLDAQAYNAEYGDTTWETCTLRQWLNNDFIYSAFSAEEQEKIQTTVVVAEDSQRYGTDAGNDTQDKIFLLSFSEAEKYFDSDEARECKATEYAIDEGCWVNDYADYYGNCDGWWLRSPGVGQFIAAYVECDGCLSEGSMDGVGGLVGDDAYGVRPAMWIELN